MDELKRRVDRLETQNRRLGGALLALLVLLGGLLLVGAGSGKGRGPLLRARELRVLDGKGHVRLKLTAASGEPALIMLDEGGQVRSVTCAAGWARFDKKGRTTVQMGGLDCLPAEKPAR